MTRELPRTHTSYLPHSHAQRWLLAHDIADPKRLQKVWRYLRQEGVRLQYSVYLISGNRQHVDKVLSRLRALINEKADDVRVYAMTENTRIWGLGTQFDDGGNVLCDELIDKLRMDTTNVQAQRRANEDLSFP